MSAAASRYVNKFILAVVPSLELMLCCEILEIDNLDYVIGAIIFANGGG